MTKENKEVESTDVIVFNSKDLFSEKAEDTLKLIETEARKTTKDVSTKAGQAEIRSSAYSLRTTKSAIETIRKDLNSKAQETINLNNKIGKDSIQRIDALITEIRQPLTDMENKEKKRKEDHQSDLNEMDAIVERIDYANLSVEVLIEARRSLNSLVEGDYEEFQEEADKKHEKYLAQIDKMIDDQTKLEEQEAELEEMRAKNKKRDDEDEAKRIQKEADDRATEKAQAEADKKIKDIQDKADQDKRVQEQKAKDKEAEDQKKIDDANALVIETKRLADEKINNEKLRVKREKEKAEEDKKKREADQKHRGKINNSALLALKEIGLSDEEGKAVITAIAKGNVPNITINY
jgi:hypothetical protein